MDNKSLSHLIFHNLFRKDHVVGRTRCINLINENSVGRMTITTLSEDLNSEFCKVSKHLQLRLSPAKGSLSLIDFITSTAFLRGTVQTYLYIELGKGTALSLLRYDAQSKERSGWLRFIKLFEEDRGC